MRKIIIQEFITLDGVMQAPGGPEEDPSSDFRYGGWTAPYFNGADEEAGGLMSLNENKTDWPNIVFLQSVDDIKKLKDSEGTELQVIGSGNLVQTLLKHDLVDEMRLMMFPITLGAGKRLFDGGAIPAAFTLTDSLVSSNGVFFASYKRAGDVKTGTVGA
jgi:hypothetical protein